MSPHPVQQSAFKCANCQAKNLKKLSLLLLGVEEALVHRAERELLAGWSWPAQRKPEANLADAVERLRETLTGKVAAGGTSV